MHMVMNNETLERLDVLSAVEQELTTGSRLMPRRADLLTLARHAEAVSAWLAPRVRAGIGGDAADVIMADKGWRGSRPLHTLTLEDRVLLRALVVALLPSLPESLQSRGPVEAFRRAPLAVAGAQYVTKTDVTAYYEYIDHELLLDELTAQTGEEPLANELGNVLMRVMGRRVGLPQVSRISDVLGDTYIDTVRRKMVRRGFATFTYSDDFRIATPSLGGARAALEACAHEVRELGLVLNERKTYTYGRDHYEASLTAFREAELSLFDSRDVFLLGDYADEEAALLEAEALMLSTDPVGGEVDDSDMVVEQAANNLPAEPDAGRVVAAERAWTLWADEDESEEVQSGMNAAITQTLLGHALPVLGAADSDAPLQSLEPLMRYEPALTPQVAAYLIAFAHHGRRNRSAVRDALDRVVGADLLSSWQSVWVAYAAGALRGSRTTRAHVVWLEEAVSEGKGAIAAHSALSLARLGHGDPQVIAAAVDRVARPWRSLVFFSLCEANPELAAGVADNELDRLLLSTAT
jgi:hypothetical protein